MSYSNASDYDFREKCEFYEGFKSADNGQDAEVRFALLCREVEEIPGPEYGESPEWDGLVDSIEAATDAQLSYPECVSRLEKLLAQMRAYRGRESWRVVIEANRKAIVAAGGAAAEGMVA